MTIVNKVSKLLDRVEDVSAITAGLLVLVSMFTVILEVLMRYFLNKPSVWVQEYNEYILLYIPFLAGAWLLRLNGHVSVDIINKFLGRKSTYILNIIVALVGIVVMTTIVYYGTLVTMDAFERNVKSTTALKTPQAYVYIIIPLGSFLLLLEFLRQLFTVKDVKNESI